MKNSTMAKLFWFEQLSENAQQRVMTDANKQNVFHVDTYKGMMFYADGRRYTHQP